MERKFVLMLCVLTPVAAGLGSGLPQAAGPAGERPTAEEWRAHVAFLTRDGDHWRTSNAEYRQGGEPEAYGMRYVKVPGGLAARGCLWGETGGAVVAVYWHFFMGWDPRSGRGLLYQSAPNGLIGIGELTQRDGPVSESVQTFVAPDGSSFELRHRSVEEDAETYRTESFEQRDGAWVPRRTYTWVRRADGPVGC